MTETGGDELGSVVRAGLRWSFGTQLALRAASFLAGVAIFRLISPADYGVYALALAVLNIAMCINDLGQDLAVLGWGDDVADVQGTSTTLAVCGSVLVYGCCWFIAPVVASSAGQADAAGVIRLTTSLVIVDGILAVPRALLFRTLRQRNISVTELAAAPVTIVASVVLAVAWPGAWAPAIGQVAGGLVSAVLTLHYAPAIPLPRFDLRRARRLLAVGMPASGTVTVEMVLLNIDSLIVAHQLGATALGFYALAFNVASWPPTIITNAVRKVSIVALNRMVQAGGDWRAAFSRSLTLLIALVVPVCLLLGALAVPLVEFLYSPKSLPAAPALRWLVVLGGMRVIFGLVLDLLVAHGKTPTTLRAELLWLLAAVPALWFGAELDGIRGVAIGHVLAAALVAGPIFLYDAACLGVPLRPVLDSLRRPALGVVAGVITAAVLLPLADAPLVQLAVAGSGTALAYVLVAVPRHQLTATASQARCRLGRFGPRSRARSHR